MAQWGSAAGGVLGDRSRVYGYPSQTARSPVGSCPLFIWCWVRDPAGKADCFVPVTAITREFVFVTVRSWSREGGTFREIPW